MKDGNWVPISKHLKQYLPRGRLYTEVEAAFSLQLDFDNGNNSISISGLSKLWGWSRKRVYTFLEKMNIEIIYQKDTTKTQNQRGQIGLQIRSRSGADKEQIRLIDSKQLVKFKSRSGADREQIRSRSGSTSIDPNPNTDPNPKNNYKIYGEFKNIKLSETEHKKLIERFGKHSSQEKIERLSQYIASKGKRYKSHYATILTWEKKDERNKGLNKKSGFQDARESTKTDWLK